MPRDSSNGTMASKRANTFVDPLSAGLELFERCRRRRHRCAAAFPALCQIAASSTQKHFPFAVVNVGRKLLEGMSAGMTGEGTSSRSCHRRGRRPFHICEG